VDDLWATESEGVGLIVRAISFHDFQPICDPDIPIHQRYRQTDRQTDDMQSQGKTALCTIVHNVHCAVKICKLQCTFCAFLGESTTFDNTTYTITTIFSDEG